MACELKQQCVWSWRRALLWSLAQALFVCASTTVTPAQVVPPSTAPPTPAARLFIAVFSVGAGADELYQKEYDRLLGICKRYTSACFSQNFSSARRLIAELHSAPNSASAVVGSVHAVLRMRGEQDLGLTIGLDVERTANPGQFAAWIDTVGDWGYGIYVCGVRPRGDWVQLVGAPFPSQAWLPTSSTSLSALVQPIGGEILRLQSVRATLPNGVRGRIPDGQYLIVRSSQTTIEFRAEVPSDMPCGDSIRPPKMMPPTLRTTPTEFFNQDGSPRFAFVYTRGC